MCRVPEPQQKHSRRKDRPIQRGLKVGLPVVGTAVPTVQESSGPDPARRHQAGISVAETGKIPDFKDWRELPKPKNLESGKTVAFQDGG